MSTTLCYNEILLQECETKLFEHEVTYDTSGTDKMYSRFRIRVSSVLVRGPSTGGGADPSHVHTPSKDNYELTNRMASIHARLSEPRKDFWMELTTQEFLGGLQTPFLLAAGEPLGTIDILHETPSPYPTATVYREQVLDVDNGPKPRHVSVQQIYNGTAIKVDFEIEVCRALAFADQTAADQYPWQVPSNTITPAITNAIQPNVANPLEPNTIVPVLSNRWSMKETRNANWAIERTVTGVLRVRHQSYFAHAFRFLCLPGLQANFQRRLQDFTDDPSGLTLKYTIVDVEREAAPPPPATDWKGSVSTTGDKGGATIIGINLQLSGKVGVDKSELLAAGGYIVAQKLPGLLARMEKEKDGAGNPFKINCILENVAVWCSLDEPVVRLDVRARTVISQYQHLAVAMKYITDPLQQKLNGAGQVSYDPKRWPIPKPLDGSAPMNLFSCYLQNPYSVWHGIPNAFSYQSSAVKETVPNDRPDAEDGPSYEKYYHQDDEITVRPADRKLIESTQLDEMPVTFYFIKNTYNTRTGKIALARATTPPTPPNPMAGVYPDHDAQYDTCRFATLHAGTCTRTIEVEAKRIGAMPQLPEPTPEITDPNGIREVLLNVEHELAGPQFTRDLVTREYSAAATYVYALSRPPRLGERLRMATSPFDKLTPEEAIVNQPDLYTDSEKIEWRKAAP